METSGRTPWLRRGVVLLVLLCPAAAARAKPATVKLKFQAEEAQERLFVPFVRRRILAEGGADLPLGAGGRLRCRVVDEDAIEVDVDGDGRFATRVRQGEILALKLRRDAGKPSRHAIRVVGDVYGRPCLEPACARVGRLRGTRIAVLDANLNGRYADYGEDLMVVGKLPYAFPLSRTVVIGRAALRIEVAEDGRSLTATQLEGPLVKLDFTSQLRGLKKPRMVVFRRAGDAAPAHVVAFRSPALVPAGAWSLAYAAISEDLWAVGGSAVKPVAVGEEPAVWAWGAPFALVGQAAVRPQGIQRTFRPPALLKAPELIENTVAGTHIVSDLPPQVVGRAGVTYVRNWQKLGAGGVGLPDARIAHVDVDITRDGKRLNADMPRWAPYDMSGLVEKLPPFWTSFEWPVGTARGTLTITFRCTSKLFGGALASESLTLDVR